MEDAEDAAANEHFRIILAKEGNQRSYDDLLVLKARIGQMDFVKKIFHHLHPRQIDELCRNMSFETFDHDEIVFNQGDHGDKLYIIITGSCDIKVKNIITDANSGASETREKVLFTCLAGQHFGERALDFNEPRAATIVTTAFTELLTVSKTVCVHILLSLVGNIY